MMEVVEDVDKTSDDRDDEWGDIPYEWAKPPELADLKADYEEAKPFHAEQVSKIEDWLENLNVTGKAAIKTDKKKNRSTVVPKLIRTQAEWRYAALSEPFLSTEGIFNVMPVSWEDVKASEQNKLVLNHQFNNKIGKVKFIDEYVRTVVDEGTVIVKTGWIYREEEYLDEQPVFGLVPDESFKKVIDDAYALQQDNPAEYETKVPYQVKEALIASTEAGIPLRPVVTGSEQVVKKRILQNHPTVEVCDFRNVIIDPTANGDINKANFIIYSFETSIADLKADGRYFNLDKIQKGSSSPLSEPDHHSSTSQSSFDYKDEPRKKLVAYEYWGFRDVEGEDELTPVLITWIGNTIVRMVENPFPDKKLPFVNVMYLPVRKSIYGEPDGALLEDHQKIIGAVTRGMIDVMGRSANGQTAMRRDMLDYTNKRRYERGEDYEFNSNIDVRQGIHAHVYPEIPQSAQFMIQLMNQGAESLTGVKAFTGGLTGDSLGTTATGVRGVLDSASKRELGILRRLAEGIIEIGKKFIAMNGEFLSETEVVRLTNAKFVSVRKDELAGQFDLKLSISTAEEDEAKAQEIAFMLQTIGPSVDFNITKLMMANVAKLRKMPELAHEIEAYEPQPDPIQQEMAQLEVEKLKMEIAKLQSETAENYANAQLDQVKQGTERAKADELSSQADKNALDFVETETGTTHVRDLEKQSQQAMGNIALEKVKAANKPKSK